MKDTHVVIKAPPKDLPLDEALAMLATLPEGVLWYLKWTCPKCKERVTCNEPMTVYKQGYIHEEREDGSPCGELYTGNMFGCFLVMGPSVLDGSFPPGTPPERSPHSSTNTT